MMSLHARYLKERAGIDCLETERGYMSYRMNGKECFIHDTFVLPEYRRAGEAAAMLEQVIAIAREQGATMITCTVCPDANGSTEAAMTILSLGFRLSGSAPGLVAFLKEI